VDRPEGRWAGGRDLDQFRIDVKWKRFWGSMASEGLKAGACGADSNRVQELSSSVALAVFVFAFVLLFFGAWVIYKPFRAKADRGSYLKSSFLSPAERSFFGALEKAGESQFQIFAKVRLADIIRPVAKSNGGSRQSAFNRISSKHVDFVLCHRGSLDTVAVVELDDSSHERARTRARDQFVDSALKQAGIPVLRIPAQRGYSLNMLREKLAEVRGELAPESQGS
jgi:hypothetical protein